MKNVKEILFSVILVLCIFLIVFGFIKYRRSKTEIADVITELTSAESRIVDITKELEEYSNELEKTIREQREVYRQLTESNRSDSETIKRIEGLNKSSEDIIRELLQKIKNRRHKEWNYYSSN